jgi:glycosyltransferase involved in cell wall biosynthesis
MRPLFSIIVPTYDRQELLNEALDSVLAQTVKDFECIVVDDASPTPALVPRDPRIGVVRHDSNRGTAAAWNTGLETASGRYVTFLADDDLLSRDRLQLALDGHERAPIAICWATHVGQRVASGRTLNGDVRDVILDGTTPSLGGTSIPREIAPRFDERFSAVEDVEWWLRAARLGSVATVRRTGYWVRRHDGPRHNNGVDARIASSLLLLEEHKSYFAGHPRAAAFRWYRIGLMSDSSGDTAAAKTAFSRALRSRASLRSAWRLARALPRSMSNTKVNV